MAEPTPMQLDALREVANIGCGHAATALSRLVGGRIVDLGIPCVVAAHTADLTAMLGGKDTPVVAATLGVVGDLEGQLMMVLPAVDASTLAGLMLRSPPEQTADADAESAISEAANIVASACLSAIGTMTGLRLLPTIPKLRRLYAGAVAEEMARETHGEQTVVLDARFSTRLAPVLEGRILMVPRGTSLRRLLERLGL